VCKGLLTVLFESVAQATIYLSRYPDRYDQAYRYLGDYHNQISMDVFYFLSYALDFGQESDFGRVHWVFFG
jgi:hypothetical protein